MPNSSRECVDQIAVFTDRRKDIRRQYTAMKRFVWILLVIIPSAFAQTPYQPSPDNLQARQSFEQARFGMFIHWGVYSIPARGEWVMQNEKIPVTEYEKFAPQFNPQKFDPAQIVSLAKQAGMKYITITSKHHDGFAMFATKQSDWNIVDATAYGRDPLKMLADECHRQGIKLFFYYSELDWHNPDYFPLGETGHSAGRPASGDWNRYIDYMNAQLRELLTNYGDLAGIWFDGYWDKPKADWHLRATYDLIHTLQPAALVGNNHHHKPNPGEDFQMFEKDLPGQNTAGFSGESEVSQLPLETCDTINNSWGYNASDKSVKTSRQIIQELVRAAGYNANFLLNIGPRADGTVQPEFVERLHEVGAWTSKYGQSIYGTHGGPITPRPWGVTTRKGNVIYVHVLDWSDPLLALPPIARVKSARLFPEGTSVQIETVADGLLLRLPKASSDPIDRVIVLER